MTFEEFWEVYPRKSCKAVARATFNEITTKGKMTATCGVKILAQSTPEELVEAALAFRYKTNIVEETEQRFIPLAATWLNQARYEDQDENERKEMADKMRNLLQHMKKPRLNVVG